MNDASKFKLSTLDCERCKTYLTEDEVSDIFDGKFERSFLCASCMLVPGAYDEYNEIDDYCYGCDSDYCEHLWIFRGFRPNL